MFFQRSGANGKVSNTKEYQDEDSSCEVFTLLKTYSCSFPSSEIENFSPALISTFQQDNCVLLGNFIPFLKEANNLDETTESHVTTDPRDIK